MGTTFAAHKPRLVINKNGLVDQLECYDEVDFGVYSLEGSEKRCLQDTEPDHTQKPLDLICIVNFSHRLL